MNAGAGVGCCCVAGGADVFVAGGVAGAPEVVGIVLWVSGAVGDAGVGGAAGAAGAGVGVGVGNGFVAGGGAVGLGATGIVCGGFGCGGVVEGAGAGAAELGGIIGPAYFANTLCNSDCSETLLMRNLVTTTPANACLTCARHRRVVVFVSADSVGRSGCSPPNWI